ncbi:MAG: twin-arginine translocation signal domain-containing protein, partial [Acidobacteria bacterium]|nr:twin-arginine translocation signal domain-containing protein [Acidobacteriota bacterium]
MSASTLTRRDLIAGVGAGAAAALLVDPHRAQAQPAPRAVVFTHTDVVTVDAMHYDVALAVVGDRIA